MTAPRDPDRLLEDLNESQREAVTQASGPLAIIAGAGSGKTRVISRRAAYAIETGVVAADRILLVTFTDKAATEMVERMAALGHRGVMAKTFHAHALAQLRTFWPAHHDGAPMPGILESSLRLLYPIARRLPGGYAFTQAKDLADAIAWAKVRRITPDRWLAEGGDRAPIPAQLFAKAYADYERAKARTGVIDFDDMLIETVSLLETDAAAAELVRSRKTWFSVDEYQDTNPLSERLLELWLGASRDLAVVGDPNQTIYSFTGATPELLLTFADRHPGATVVRLPENHRSTPQVLELANRLLAADGPAGGGPSSGGPGALRATLPAGPAPSIRRHRDDEAEREAIVTAIRGLVGQGIDAAEIAILVRVNAQLPELEQALTRAGIAFRVRGQRFFERREVKDARRLLATQAARGGDVPGAADPPGATGPALIGTIRKLFEQRLGLGAAGDQAGDETREREASLQLLLGIVGDLVGSRTGVGLTDVIAELDRREAEEASGSADGVNLLTYHRAKGLEWDAVFLPALEEGLLPIRQAKEDAAIDEERRLLYVGITRARRHLALSWAARRAAVAGGKEGARKPSRFLDALEPSGARRAAMPSGSGVNRRIAALERPDGPDAKGSDVDASLLEALQRWRRDRARADAVPAYVVAHDSMLFAIAEARPVSASALARVKGMGPAKLEKYGDEILGIVGRAV